MDIEEIIDKKKKLEIEIRDSINVFMKETKVIVDNVDLGIELIHLEWGGLHEFREVFISVKL